MIKFSNQSFSIVLLLSTIVIIYSSKALSNPAVSFTRNSRIMKNEQPLSQIPRDSVSKEKNDYNGPILSSDNHRQARTFLNISSWGRLFKLNGTMISFVPLGSLLFQYGK